MKTSINQSDEDDWSFKNRIQCVKKSKWGKEMCILINWRHKKERPWEMLGKTYWTHSQREGNAMKYTATNPEW